MRTTGASALSAKLTSRFVDKRPLLTATGSEAGAYDTICGTSRPSSCSAISDSRDSENGFVRPVIDNCEPSMRACSDGVTNNSVVDARLAINGIPIDQRSITWCVLSRRSSKSIRPFSTQIFDTENRAGLLDGLAEGFENFSTRSEKLKRCASKRTI